MFFGMIRQSCGGDDHPSANQFLFMYRILSVSSLIKSPKRASVQTEPSRILLSMQSAPTSRTSGMAAIHSRLLEKLCPSEINILPSADFVDVMFAHCSDSAANEDDLDSLLLAACETSTVNLDMDCTDENCEDLSGDAVGERLLMTCDADVVSTPEQCISYYLAGYVAYKLKKFTKCECCIQSLVSVANDICSDARLILLRTRGGLQFPSEQLLALLSLVEQCVEKHSAKMCANMYMEIIDDVMNCNELATLAIGCPSHTVSITSRCIHFYISTRLHFLNRAHNKRRSSRQEKQKLSKISKLT